MLHSFWSLLQKTIPSSPVVSHNKEFAAIEKSLKGKWSQIRGQRLMPVEEKSGFEKQREKAKSALLAAAPGLPHQAGLSSLPERSDLSEIL